MDSLPPPPHADAAPAATRPADSASLVTAEKNPATYEPTETSVADASSDAEVLKFGPDLDDSQIFRHSGWAVTRSRIYKSLQRTEQSQARREAFCHCGKNAWVYESTLEDAPGLRVACDWCHDRFCEPCGTARAFANASKLVAACEGKSVRFLTLTLRGKKGSPLAPLVKRLYATFRELRATSFWNQHVDGGAAFLEIKHTKFWHPHLHVIIEGSFIEQSRLSSLWESLTGDSFRVDIRAIDSSGNRLEYAAKYASKPLDASFVKRPRLLDEAVCALKGVRMITTFGTWYGRLSDDDEIEGVGAMLGGSPVWRRIGTLPDVFRRALNGDVRCILALKVLRQTRTVPSNPQPPPNVDSLDLCAAYTASQRLPSKERD